MKQPKSEPKAIEDAWFDYDGFDILDTACFAFYDAELKQPIGELPAGSKLSCIELNYEKSTALLYRSDENIEPLKFKLRLEIS